MASLGEQLGAARRARGQSLEDVSNDTNISKRYLEALEEDNYDMLPGQVYVVGFLGSYAKYLGLDTEAMLKQYNKLATFSKLFDESAYDTVAKRKKRRVNRKRVVVLLIALLSTILCLVVLLWLRKT